MVPVNPGNYTFRKESLAALRQHLGLSQAQMATKLGVPKNTVSRWETGATAPDAHSLAAIYSVAKENGTMPNFFVPSKQKASIRDTALVYWDINGLAPRGLNIEGWDSFIVNEVNKRVPKPKNLLFKAFSRFPALVNNQLHSLNWEVWEGDADLSHHARSEAGQDPDGSAVFLITTNTGHVDLVKKLKDNGVRIYLMAPSSVSDALIESVGRKWWINLDGLPGMPIVIKVNQFDFLS